MKNKSTKILKYMLCLILCVSVLSLVSCSLVVTDKSQPNDNIPNTKDNFQSKNETGVNENQPEADTFEVTYTLRYYDVIEDVEKEFTETKSFEEKIVPEYFIRKLAELMNTSISVNGISFDEDKLFIDFSSDSSPLRETGAHEESCILDSITSVLFDVFPETKEIHITADGKDYDSGHTILPKGTPYATRQEHKVG